MKQPCISRIRWIYRLSAIFHPQTVAIVTTLFSPKRLPGREYVTVKANTKFKLLSFILFLFCFSFKTFVKTRKLMAETMSLSKSGLQPKEVNSIPYKVHEKRNRIIYRHNSNFEKPKITPIFFKRIFSKTLFFNIDWNNDVIGEIVRESVKFGLKKLAKLPAIFISFWRKWRRKKKKTH